MLTTRNISLPSLNIRAVEIINKKISSHMKRTLVEIKNNVVCVEITNLKSVNIEAYKELNKHSGFNITDNSIIFQRLTQALKNEKYSTKNKIFSKFDFNTIGLRAQNKKKKSVEQLLSRMEVLRVSSSKFENFFDGLGKKEFNRLLLEDCKHLLSLLLKTNLRLTELLDLNETNIKYHYKWVLSLIKIKKYKLALQEAQKLFEFDELNPEYYNLYANILKYLRMWDES